MEKFLQTFIFQFDPKKTIFVSIFDDAILAQIVFLKNRDLVFSEKGTIIDIQDFFRINVFQS